MQHHRTEWTSDSRFGQKINAATLGDPRHDKQASFCRDQGARRRSCGAVRTCFILLSTPLSHRLCWLQVCLFYLVLRGHDTFEDDMSILPCTYFTSISSQVGT
jgi:hypothetical protein